MNSSVPAAHDVIVKELASFLSLFGPVHFFPPVLNLSVSWPRNRFVRQPEWVLYLFSFFFILRIYLFLLFQLRCAVLTLGMSSNGSNGGGGGGMMVMIAVVILMLAVGVVMVVAEGRLWLLQGRSRMVVGVVIVVTGVMVMGVVMTVMMGVVGVVVMVVTGVVVVVGVASVAAASQVQGHAGGDHLGACFV